MKTDEGSLSETQPLPVYSVNDKLPRLGQWVMLEAPSVRCLGFLDPRGGWRDARDGHLIENVQSWAPLNQAETGRTVGEHSRALTTG